MERLRRTLERVGVWCWYEASPRGLRGRAGLPPLGSDKAGTPSARSAVDFAAGKSEWTFPGFEVGSAGRAAAGRGVGTEV